MNDNIYKVFKIPNVSDIVEYKSKLSENNTNLKNKKKKLLNILDDIDIDKYTSSDDIVQKVYNHRQFKTDENAKLLKSTQVIPDTEEEEQYQLSTINIDKFIREFMQEESDVNLKLYKNIINYFYSLDINDLRNGEFFYMTIIYKLNKYLKHQDKEYKKFLDQTKINNTIEEVNVDDASIDGLVLDNDEVLREMKTQADKYSTDIEDHKDALLQKFRERLILQLKRNLLSVKKVKTYKKIVNALFDYNTGDSITSELIKYLEKDINYNKNNTDIFKNILLNKLFKLKDTTMFINNDDIDDKITLTVKVNAMLGTIKDRKTKTLSNKDELEKLTDVVGKTLQPDKPDEFTEYMMSDISKALAKKAQELAEKAEKAEKAKIAAELKEKIASEASEKAKKTAEEAEKVSAKAAAAAKAVEEAAVEAEKAAEKAAEDESLLPANSSAMQSALSSNITKLKKTASEKAAKAANEAVEAKKKEAEVAAKAAEAATAAAKAKLSAEAESAKVAAEARASAEAAKEAAKEAVDSAEAEAATKTSAEASLESLLKESQEATKASKEAEKELKEAEAAVKTADAAVSNITTKAEQAKLEAAKEKEKAAKIKAEKAAKIAIKKATEHTTAALKDTKTKEAALEAEKAEKAKKAATSTSTSTSSSTSTSTSTTTGTPTTGGNVSPYITMTGGGLLYNTISSFKTSYQCIYGFIIITIIILLLYIVYLIYKCQIYNKKKYYIDSTYISVNQPFI
jgi:hypothetical protein